MFVQFPAMILALGLSGVAHGQSDTARPRTVHTVEVLRSTALYGGMDFTKATPNDRHAGGAASDLGPHTTIVRRVPAPIPAAYEQRCPLAWRVDELFSDLARALADLTR